MSCRYPFASAALLLVCAVVPRSGAEGRGAWRSTLDALCSFGYPLGPGIGVEFRTANASGLVFGGRAAMTPLSYSILFPRSMSDDESTTEAYRVLDSEWGVFGGFLLSTSPVWEALFDLSFGGYIGYRGGHFIDETIGIDTEYTGWSWLPEFRLNLTALLYPRALFRKPGEWGFRIGIRAGIPIREPSYVYSRAECTVLFSWRLFAGAPETATVSDCL